MCLLFSIIILISAWAMGNFEPRTKVYITLAYAGSWLLLLVEGSAFMIAQAIFCLVIGAFTFAGGWRGR